MTVLNQPASNRHDRAVRWRQLVDLVARAGANADSAVFARALDEISAIAPQIDPSVRAAAARAVAALPLPLALMEVFACDKLAVSAPVLAAASLVPQQWQSLLALADDETRNFVATLHPEIELEESDSATVPIDDNPVLTDTLVLTKPVPIPTSGDVGPVRNVSRSLAEVVARIEHKQRRQGAISRLSASTSADNGLALFRWECSPSGEIQWVEGVPRGSLIGRSIAQPRGQDGEGPAAEVARAFAHRAPFRDAPFLIAGQAKTSGEWLMSGVPAFEPSDGRFAGYRGIAMRSRPSPASAGNAAPSPSIADPDSLRELVHEIKTPLNAIIGFAEIIDGQFLGPADRRYRRRAAHIVGQARLLLGAIDDLDFAAKVQAEAAHGVQHTALGAVVERIVPELRLLFKPRGVEIEASRTVKNLDAAIGERLAERVIARMVTAVADQAERGERLRLTVDRVGERCRVAISRPAALRNMPDDKLFGVAPSEESASAPGFSLRLARGLARVANIGITTSERDISLIFDCA